MTFTPGRGLVPIGSSGRAWELCKPIRGSSAHFVSFLFRMSHSAPLPYSNSNVTQVPMRSQEEQA